MIQNSFFDNLNKPNLLRLVNFNGVKARDLAKELNIPTLNVYRKLFAIDRIDISVKIRCERLGKVTFVKQPNFNYQMENSYQKPAILLKLKWLAEQKNNIFAQELYNVLSS